MTRKEKIEEFKDSGYNVNVIGRHVEVTEPMKDYAIEKISKLVKLGPRLIDVKVTMDIQKLEHRVDIWMQFNNLEIKSHAVSDNMYASIDKAADRLQDQLLKYKDRIQDHHARGAASIDMNVNVIRTPEEEELQEINVDIEEENHVRLMKKFTPHKVVAQEKRALKKLRLDEAIMKLDLSGDQFLVYLSEEEGGKLRVIYKRKDGDFGVIQPEA